MDAMTSNRAGLTLGRGNGSHLLALDIWRERHTGVEAVSIYQRHRNGALRPRRVCPKRWQNNSNVTHTWTNTGGTRDFRGSFQPKGNVRAEKYSFWRFLSTRDVTVFLSSHRNSPKNFITKMSVTVVTKILSSFATEKYIINYSRQRDKQGDVREPENIGHPMVKTSQVDRISRKFREPGYRFSNYSTMLYSSLRNT